MDTIYLTPEHALLREQIARFVAREVEPHALAWEEAGHTPRDVLRKMGAAGLLGLMYAGEHGGGEFLVLAFAPPQARKRLGGGLGVLQEEREVGVHHASAARRRPVNCQRWCG